MEEQLNELLLDGEEVRWTGRPAPFRLLATPSRTALLATWIVSGVVLAVLLGALIPFYLRNDRSMTDLLIMVIIASFLPLMISFHPVLDKRSLERNTLYAITNYRVIALVKDTVMYIPISSRLKTAVSLQDGSCGHLCFDGAVDVTPRQQLTAAVVGVRMEGSSNPNVQGMMFYHVNDPESLLGYLT